MKVAIYSRKSKFTGKGESIGNQIEMCKTYALNNIDKDVEFIIYEDEGFSAKNTDRPKFQEMIADAESKKFNILICYKLDRISRNVADFSTLVDKLQDLNIDFVSIKEQFDTITPMGRAMMYISSVFAQLERETIAERVKDNMLELAKTGRWLGGQTPLGYDSKAITYFDSEMKERKMFKLTQNEKELQTIRLIYDKYLETKSLSQTVKYLSQNCIKTKLGKDVWHKKTIQTILNNPVYVKANKNVVDYLESLGMMVVGNVDNRCGILTFNKKRGTTNTRGVSEWIAAVAKHNGVISAEDWLKVQSTLEVNKEKAPRLGKTNTVLLTGLLKCNLCGSNMKVIHSRDSKGEKIYYYKCTLKEGTGNSRCDNANIRSNHIEDMVISQLEEWSSDTGYLVSTINNYNNSIVNVDYDDIIKEIKILISEKEKQIENLVSQMSFDSTLVKYIAPQIKILDDEINELKSRLEDNSCKKLKSKSEEINISIVLDAFKKIKNIRILPLDEQKLILSTVLNSIYWDGSTGDVRIQLYGSVKKN